MSCFNEWTPATAEDCKARWSCGNPGEKFRCYFCGHKFAVGDVFKAIYSNSTPGAPGNPLCCAACRGDKTDDQLRVEWSEKWAEWRDLTKNRFWWFTGKTS